MDARDISKKLLATWADNWPKNSGSIEQPVIEMKAVVWTNDGGYREVVDVRFNTRLGIIELVLDEE
jgi:hypothetical protein